jgi:Uncharacterized protein family UPF0004
MQFMIDDVWSDALGSLQADVILVMTCAIREGAEQKIWKRLEFIKSLKKLRLKDQSLPPLKIGILGTGSNGCVNVPINGNQFTMILPNLEIRTLLRTTYQRISLK